MDEINRVMDRGKGPFCKTDKQGNALPLPPDVRDPVRNKSNPRGVRHPFKTQQDRMPVSERPRVQEALKRAEKMKAGAK